MRLILAEKPSVAVDIAKALGSAQRREGYYQVGQDVVTYAIGHLVSIDDSAAPPKWSLDTIPIFPDHFQLHREQNDLEAVQGRQGSS